MFLCKTHQKELRKNAIRALHYWRQWLEQGADDLKQKQYLQAGQYLGCAFDVTELLLEYRCHFDETWLNRIDRFMVSGHYLSEVYCKLGQLEKRDELLRYIHARLLAFSQQRGDYTRKRLQENVQISQYLLDKANISLAPIASDNSDMNLEIYVGI